MLATWKQQRKTLEGFAKAIQPTIRRKARQKDDLRISLGCALGIAQACIHGKHPLCENTFVRSEACHVRDMLEKLIFVYHVYPAASGIPWQALPAFWQGADPSWVGPRLTAALTILRYQVGSDILSSLSGIGYRRVTLAAAKATDNITHMTICETIGNIAFKSWNISGLLS